ncbi:MAG: hypothetical protein EOO27_00935 [Comamonadaceae bacterium]|nr:MAG: hypothetical protein EOO27_00935 [Comamonadaceae bacterium]
METPALSVDARIQAVAADLHAAVIASAGAMKMSGDLRVSEESAAQLLGISRPYLKMLRQAGKAPPSYARGVGGGRVSYRLIDLASWIEGARP